MLASGEGTIKVAAHVGVDRVTLWKWGKLPAFQEAMDGIKRARIDEAEHAIAESQHLAVQALVDVATNGVNENARVTAAKTLLEQGRGAPSQAMSISHGANAWLTAMAEVSDDEEEGE